MTWKYLSLPLLYNLYHSILTYLILIYNSMSSEASRGVQCKKINTFLFGSIWDDTFCRSLFDESRERRRRKLSLESSTCYSPSRPPVWCLQLARGELRWVPEKLADLLRLLVGLMIIVKHGASIRGKILIPKFMLFPLHHATHNGWKQYFTSLNSHDTWVVTLSNM